MKKIASKEKYTIKLISNAYFIARIVLTKDFETSKQTNCPILFNEYERI